ncbi:hypothetical protein QS257_17725 [Terrilactibacillus sp. S3-3]|nr:hypothetical protein QS257_17725 [Terrilactibacillus sp. S3-3]
MEQSIQELQKIGLNHVTTDKIKAVCAKNQMGNSPVPLNSEETKAITHQAERHLKMYDELFDTAGVGY